MTTNEVERLISEGQAADALADGFDFSELFGDVGESLQKEAGNLIKSSTDSLKKRAKSEIDKRIGVDGKESGDNTPRTMPTATEQPVRRVNSDTQNAPLPTAGGFDIKTKAKQLLNKVTAFDPRITSGVTGLAVTLLTKSPIAGLAVSGGTYFGIKKYKENQAVPQLAMRY